MNPPGGCRYAPYKPLVARHWPGRRKFKRSACQMALLRSDANAFRKKYHCAQYTHEVWLLCTVPAGKSARQSPRGGGGQRISLIDQSCCRCGKHVTPLCCYCVWLWSLASLQHPIQAVLLRQRVASEHKSPGSACMQNQTVPTPPPPNANELIYTKKHLSSVRPSCWRCRRRAAYECVRVSCPSSLAHAV